MSEKRPDRSLITPHSSLAGSRNRSGNTVLAISDNLTVFLAIFQLVFSFVVSLTLWRLTAWQRRYDGLEQRLHDATTRLVDERFRSMTHEVNSHVQGFLLSLE